MTAEWETAKWHVSTAAPGEKRNERARPDLSMGGALRAITPAGNYQTPP